MDTSIYSKPDKELLEWELSLNSSDLRSHAWYHGNVPRNVAEHLLEDNGEFLVRDSSTYARSGDLVLSTKWNECVLHFLIHKEVLQPDTIYEQLGYRFENESFTTVQDLITYYVGNREAISAKSGAIISLPRTREVPVSRKDRIHPMLEFANNNEYVSLSQEASRQVLPVEAILIEKSFLSEGLYQVSLNLKPPDGLLEDLEDIPDSIRNLSEYQKAVSFDAVSDAWEHFDLSTFSSILLPTKLENVTLNKELIQMINSRIMETSNIAMAFYITKVDWEILHQSEEEENEDSNNPNGNEIKTKCLYETFLNEKAFRWKHVVERCLSFSHFVAMSVFEAEFKEEILNKWIGVANELKSAMGNFMSFCNIMRGLTCSKLTSTDGPIDWLKLRREFTSSAFAFETSLRNAYHNLLQGTESYPPNTTIPNLLQIALLLDDNVELFPLLKNASSQDKLNLTVSHMRQLNMFCDSEKIYNRNWQRIVKDTIVSQDDIILTDICRTEIHLLILWGLDFYKSSSLLERCKIFDKSY